MTSDSAAENKADHRLPREDVRRVIWLFGPSGIGKSTLGWALYRRLCQERAAGFIDTDQIGMCYPAPDADPGNYRLRAKNLGTIWNTLKACGATELVIAGVLDDVQTAQLYAEALGEWPLLVRLRAHEDELRSHIQRRGWNLHLTEQVIEHAHALDGIPFGDVTVETSGLTAGELVEHVLCSLPNLPQRLLTRPGSELVPARPGGPLHVVGISGPRGAGKSSVAFTLFQRLLKSGVAAGYIDSAQLGFFAGPSVDPSKTALSRAENLGAVLHSFAQEGAEIVVVSGDSDGSELRQLLIRDVRIELFELVADQESLAQRLRLRSEGHGPPIPGDDLIGISEETVQRLAAAGAHDRIGRTAQHVETSKRTVPEIAEAIYRKAGLAKR